MNRIWMIVGLCSFCISILLSQELLSPKEYLRSDYGVEFTRFEDFSDYIRYLTDHSAEAEEYIYGYTEEGRKLRLIFIGSENLLKNKEAIRRAHRASLGIDSGEAAEEIPILWLSFGVHGNEAGASESALQVLYELLSPQTGSRPWLDEVLIIVDPSVNPDGYSKYTHWNRAVSGRSIDVDPSTYEHDEPWPGGRLNHYQFDLNRDWAWATQVETQQRLESYTKWLPHVHVDYHEMFYNDHYYFAPAAEPYLEQLSDYQRDFQKTIGSAHAAVFDAEEWPYFTGEIFDLFYPSYGDTYPMLNGAIGMTYEQGGHSRAGRAIRREAGDTLTLQDRIDHHTATAMSTIATSIQNKAEILKGQQDFYTAHPGEYKSYIIHGGDAATRSIRRLMDRHGIIYGRAKSDKRYSSAYNYRNFREGNAMVRSGDIVIPGDQSKSQLVEVLFNPENVLSDSLTYDITAWSLLHGYPGDAYALKQIPDYTPYAVDIGVKSGPQTGLAYVIPLENISSYKMLADLSRAGYTYAYNTRTVQFHGIEYPAGSAFFRSRDQRIGNISDAIYAASTMHRVDYDILHTGLSEAGPDLGAEDMYIRSSAPRIALVTGAEVDANSNGYYWHFFDKELNYPVSRLPLDALSGDLSAFDIIIFPHGRYSDDGHITSVLEWVRSGGKLIAEMNALQALMRADSSLLTAKTPMSSEEDEVEIKVYADINRSRLSRHNPGIVLRGETDPTHPVTAPLGEDAAVIVSGSKSYDWIDDGYNILYTGDDYRYHGFRGSELSGAYEKAMLAGIKPYGSGEIVMFSFQPVFRGFWETGKLLLAGSVFH